MFLNDHYHNFSNAAKLITFKEKSKVKSHVRRGRVVKQHNRKRDMLIGGGIGVAGVGLLGGAYMLGRRGKLSQVPPVNNTGLDELANLLKQKQNINVAAPNVTVTTPKAITKVRLTKGGKQSIQSNVTMDNSKQLDEIASLLREQKNTQPTVIERVVTVNNTENSIQSSINAKPSIEKIETVKKNMEHGLYLLLVRWNTDDINNPKGIGVRLDVDKLNSENYRSGIISGVIGAINETLYSIEDYIR